MSYKKTLSAALYNIGSIVYIRKETPRLNSEVISRHIGAGSGAILYTLKEKQEDDSFRYRYNVKEDDLQLLKQANSSNNNRSSPDDVEPYIAPGRKSVPGYTPHGGSRRRKNKRTSKKKGKRTMRKKMHRRRRTSRV